MPARFTWNFLILFGARRWLRRGLREEQAADHSVQKTAENAHPKLISCQNLKYPLLSDLARKGAVLLYDAYPGHKRLKIAMQKSRQLQTRVVIFPDTVCGKISPDFPLKSNFLTIRAGLRLRIVFDSTQYDVNNLISFH